MILALSLEALTHPLTGEGYNFWSGIGSDISEVMIFGALIAAYRKIECHQTNCHRIGRFVHGHFHLCAIHHPHVPADGRINQTHIDEVTKRKAHPNPSKSVPPVGSTQAEDI